jgi:hypothetical protein
MRTASIALMLLTLPLLGALAADKPVPRPLKPAVGGDVSVMGYGDRETTCRQWTDGCRTCARNESGDPLCSNIGPACQPVAVTCSQRAEPAKK